MLVAMLLLGVLPTASEAAGGKLNFGYPSAWRCAWSRALLLGFAHSAAMLPVADEGVKRDELLKNQKTCLSVGTSPPESKTTRRHCCKRLSHRRIALLAR
jgi:hypothetical protein